MFSLLLIVERNHQEEGKVALGPVVSRGYQRQGTLAEIRADSLNAAVKWHVSIRIRGSEGALRGGQTRLKWECGGESP